MDVLHFLSIAYKAYEGSTLNSLVYDGASLTETFNGIIIESYYGIFCAKIITRFGVIRISGDGCGKDKPIEDYIKSRITFKEIIQMNYCNKTGCIGPFFLVTHIDGIPVEHDNLEGINYETYYKYITRIPFTDRSVSNFPGYIEDCMKRGLVKDTAGIIDRLADPDYYPEAVLHLAKDIPYKEYRGRLVKDIYFHIFGLLHQKRMLLF